MPFLLKHSFLIAGEPWKICHNEVYLETIIHWICLIRVIHEGISLTKVRQFRLIAATSLC